jgi:hypothetical protein
LKYTASFALAPSRRFHSRAATSAKFVHEEAIDVGGQFTDRRDLLDAQFAGLLERRQLRVLHVLGAEGRGRSAGDVDGDRVGAADDGVVLC